MTKVPFKQQVADLSLLYKMHGIRHIVICPGSRNAPFIQVFERDKDFTCHSIVDERVAGYVALGMAKQLFEPVLVITTSGTAALNLAPAVAEAYNQHLPLFVLTADRPPEWPPQFGNQRINQEGIFQPNIKYFFDFPTEAASAEEMALAYKSISGIIANARKNKMGPFHLNVQLKEPLYNIIVEATLDSHVYPLPEAAKQQLNNKADEDLISAAFLNAKNVLIIAGMDRYGESETKILSQLSSHLQVAIIAENLSNLTGNAFISAPELVLGSSNIEEHSGLQPDLVITLGGQIVSKKTRLFIQGLKNTPVLALEYFPLELFEKLGSRQSDSENKFGRSWKDAEEEAWEKGKTFLKNAAYCNMTALLRIMDEIPAHTHVHFGNSGTIRYSQLRPLRPDLRYYANRGTSGIDGSLSSAVGAAMVSKEQHLIILGDLSFVYDSNALWNADFPKNLKIIILNDQGGGIFRLLDGPGRMPFFEKYSVTSHPVSLRHLTEAFGLEYLHAKDFSSLYNGLEKLFSDDNAAGIFELETAESENSSIFKEFYKFILNQ